MIDSVHRVNDHPEEHLPPGVGLTDIPVLHEAGGVSEWVGAQAAITATLETTRSWGEDAGMPTDAAWFIGSAGVIEVAAQDAEPPVPQDSREEVVAEPGDEPTQSAGIGGTPVDPPDTTRTGFENPEPEDDDNSDSAANDPTFAQKLEERRSELDISERRLSRELDISRPAAKALLTGEGIVDPELASRAMDLLGFDESEKPVFLAKVDAENDARIAANIEAVGITGLAAALEHRRQKQGITQEALAEEIGASVQSVSSMLIGSARTRPETVERALTALGFSDEEAAVLRAQYASESRARTAHQITAQSETATVEERHDFGADTNRERLEMGLTRKELAEAAGVSEQTIDQFLRGRGADPTVIRSVLQVMGKTPEQIEAGVTRYQAETSLVAGRPETPIVFGYAGSELRGLRDAAGASNRDLAAAAGVSLSVIEKLLGGRAYPDSETVDRVLSALGVSGGDREERLANYNQEKTARDAAIDQSRRERMQEHRRQQREDS